MSTAEKSKTPLPETSPLFRLHRLIMGYGPAQVTRTFAQLGLADYLADGPRAAAEIATAKEVDYDALTRYLRAAVAVGLAEEPEYEQFAVTEMGALLSEGSRMRNVAITFAGPALYRPCERMLEVVKTGRSSTEAALGQGLWEYYDTHEEDAKHYAESMCHLTARCAESLVKHYDFTTAKKIVDIGGGLGVLLSGILAAAPQAEGVLYDRAEVISRAHATFEEHGLADRTTLIPGNFLESIPAGGDVYTIKSVLCDWSDEHVAQILANARKVVEPGGRLLVIDWMIVDDPRRPDPAANLPMANFGLLIASGGKVRNRKQFEELLRGAGFEVAGITSFHDGLTGWNLIEAR